MSSTKLHEQIARLTAQVADRPLDAELDARLNRQHGVGSASYRALKSACETGVSEGWLCSRAGEGIRYGRIHGLK